ncbi:DedA family protein [Secundilactobacillus collinoides]|uniref:Alkaline phosphatase n=2 Tax=Secundilactobacillus collinoides TaxID=33960 RepID=A0A0R2B8W7_SECCO|nr:DedA family protein [Secundilactobacillus collinoides]KRM74994.1 alkaline phosphatase [Secundilactobacillus collinoides DSM 20515 = JCM 1123]KZL43336.1 alkaline phosphatase [Secundilactobacillus collinoides]
MDTNTIMTLIDQYGYLAVGLLIALENIFPPIPSEIILTFTGFVILSTSMTIPGAILAATAGSVLGAIILYGIGSILTEERLNRLLATRTGRLLRLKPRDVNRAFNFFQHHGGKAIFLGRFIPVVRSLISIPAGMAEYPLLRFTLLSAIGTAIWNTVLISAGYLAGDNWQTILTTIESFSSAITVIVIAAFFLAGCYYLRKRRTKTTK